jgi:hypothetical protein
VARRTARPEGIVHHLGLALSKRPGQSFAQRLLLPVSNDTLLRVAQRRAYNGSWTAPVLVPNSPILTLDAVGPSTNKHTIARSRSALHRTSGSAAAVKEGRRGSAYPGSGNSSLVQLRTPTKSRGHYTTHTHIAKMRQSHRLRFTSFGIENLKELIEIHKVDLTIMERYRGSWAGWHGGNPAVLTEWIPCSRACLEAGNGLTGGMMIKHGISVKRNVSTTLIHPGSEFKLC